MSIRHYSNTAPQLSLASNCSSTDTTIVVTTGFTGFPTVPFFATIDADTASQEVVLVTATSGTGATITRAQDGTVAIGHNAGATVQHTVVAQDFTEANAHVNATTGIHGLPAGDGPVGLTATQTLTNKTLTNPAINGGACDPATLTVSGATSLAGVTASGNVSVGGVLSGAGSLALPHLFTTANCTSSDGTLYVNGTASGSQFYGTASRLDPVASAGTDTVGMLVTGTPNTLVIPTGKGGQYRLSVNLPWTPNSAGADGAFLYVTVTLDGTPIASIADNAFGPSSAIIPPRIRTMNDGQKIELHALAQLCSSALLYEVVSTQSTRAILLLEKIS